MITEQDAQLHVGRIAAELERLERIIGKPMCARIHAVLQDGLKALEDGFGIPPGGLGVDSGAKPPRI